MSALLLGVLSLISGGQRYTEDQVTTEPIGGGEGFGGGGAGVRNGELPPSVSTFDLPTVLEEIRAIPVPEILTIYHEEPPVGISPYTPEYEAVFEEAYQVPLVEVREYKTKVRATIREAAGLPPPEPEVLMPVETGGYKPGRVTR